MGSTQCLDYGALFLAPPFPQGATDVATEEIHSPAIPSSGTSDEDTTSIPVLHDIQSPVSSRQDHGQSSFPTIDFSGVSHATQVTNDRKISLETQLSQLNLALSKHVAHMNATRRRQPATQPLTPPQDLHIACCQPLSPATLAIGKVLALTDRFKKLLRQLSTEDCLNHQRVNQTPTKIQDNPSTTFLALSCYLQLKHTHMNVLQTLHRLLDEGERPDDVSEPLPGLTIEGFPLAGHWQLQVGIMLQVCKQMFDSIESVSTIDGKIPDKAPSAPCKLISEIWRSLKEDVI